MLPTRITGKITFGSEDPAVTGTVLALLGMTIPFHKNKIMVNPLLMVKIFWKAKIFLKRPDLWSCTYKDSNRALF